MNLFKIKSNVFVQILLSLLIVFLTRLPFLSGPHVYFDGDEAIVGIMAQDLLQGRNVPVYFYGQQYGFSFFEVVSVAMGILLFGNTVWALKWGGLFVFSWGIFFLLRTCTKKNISLWASLLIICIVCCFPPWLLWATKPRGGYITAFTCSCALVYIFQLYHANYKNILMASLLLAIGIHAQLLIIVPVSFYFLGWLLIKKKWSLIFYAGIVLAVVVFLLKLPAYLNEPYWKVPLSTTFHWKNLYIIFSEFISLMNGSYYYELTFFPGRMLAILSCLYFSGMLTILVFNIKLFPPPSKGMYLYLSAGTVVSFLLIILMNGGVYRYSLGFFSGIFLILFVTLLQYSSQKKSGYKMILVILLLFGAGCSWRVKNIPSFWQQPYANDMSMYKGLTNQLKNMGTQHVFVMDPMIQWMLNYSGFRARSTSVNERINTYSAQVNDCYTKPGCNTALVGLVGFFEYHEPIDSLNDWDKKVVLVNDRFFVYPNPEPRHLKAAGFE